MEDQALITGTLTVQQLRENIADVALFLDAVGGGPFHASYGVGCKVPPDELWQPLDIKPERLADFIADSEQRQVFRLGKDDINVWNQEGSASFKFCHESDLHFYSSDPDLLSRVALMWKNKGYRVYSTPAISKGPVEAKEI